jgi:hypothetical protein
MALQLSASISSFPSQDSKGAMKTTMAARFGFPKNVMGLLPGTDMQVACVSESKVDSLFGPGGTPCDMDNWTGKFQGLSSWAMRLRTN